MVTDPSVTRLTTAIEDFNSVFIRLPTSDQRTFSALSVLHTLSRVGPCRLSTLLGTEQIKQPALTAAVAKLSREGLVARAPDPSDGRASLLSLTDAGRAVVSRRHADRAARLGALLDQLAPSDRSRLVGVADVLDRVVQLAHQPAHQPQKTRT